MIQVVNHSDIHFGCSSLTLTLFIQTLQEKENLTAALTEHSATRCCSRFINQMIINHISIFIYYNITLPK